MRLVTIAIACLGLGCSGCSHSNPTHSQPKTIPVTVVDASALDAAPSLPIDSGPTKKLRMDLPVNWQQIDFGQWSFGLPAEFVQEPGKHQYSNSVFTITYDEYNGTAQAASTTTIVRLMDAKAEILASRERIRGEQHTVVVHALYPIVDHKRMASLDFWRYTDDKPTELAHIRFEADGLVLKKQSDEVFQIIDTLQP